MRFPQTALGLKEKLAARSRPRAIEAIWQDLTASSPNEDSPVQECLLVLRDSLATEDCKEDAWRKLRDQAGELVDEYVDALDENASEDDGETEEEGENSFRARPNPSQRSHPHFLSHESYQARRAAQKSIGEVGGERVRRHLQRVVMGSDYCIGEAESFRQKYWGGRMLTSEEFTAFLLCPAIALLPKEELLIWADVLDLLAVNIQRGARQLTTLVKKTYVGKTDLGGKFLPGWGFDGARYRMTIQIPELNIDVEIEKDTSHLERMVTKQKLLYLGPGEGYQMNGAYIVPYFGPDETRFHWCYPGTLAFAFALQACEIASELGCTESEASRFLATGELPSLSSIYWEEADNHQSAWIHLRIHKSLLPKSVADAYALARSYSLPNEDRVLADLSYNVVRFVKHKAFWMEGNLRRKLQKEGKLETPVISFTMPIDKQVLGDIYTQFQWPDTVPAASRTRARFTEIYKRACDNRLS